MDEYLTQYDVATPRSLEVGSLERGGLETGNSIHPFAFSRFLRSIVLLPNDSSSYFFRLTLVLP
jgi:hypothetical protein